ncbi:hypothetical protein SNE40_002812 [Patella caerulea]|uniref:Uncharacterized protein n=1 Tax=Patella caerulea TaxID=87958 RepID=A0AAN8KEQ1_PATCE
MEKATRPANLEVYFSRVNKEIWGCGNVKPSTRSKDIKLQKLGEKIVKISYSVTTLTDQLLTLKKQMPKMAKQDLNEATEGNKTVQLQITEAIRTAMDSLAILGAALTDFNQGRRDLFKPDLRPKTKPICNFSNNLEVEAGQLLFGEDLNKKLKDLKDTDQALGFGFSNQGLSYQRYNNFGGSNRNYTNQRPKYGYNNSYNKSGPKPFLESGYKRGP